MEKKTSYYAPLIINFPEYVITGVQLLSQAGRLVRQDYTYKLPDKMFCLMRVSPGPSAGLFLRSWLAYRIFVPIINDGLSCRFM